jgi:hypothetical protein
MREKRAAPRWLPLQRAAQGFGLNGQDDQPILATEMPTSRLLRLVGG